MKDLIITLAFFIPAGILLIVIGIKRLFTFVHYKKVRATCIDVSTRGEWTEGTQSESMKFDHFGRYVLMYKGIFKYNFNGKEIISNNEKSRMDFWSSIEKFQVDHIYTIFVNPEEPDIFATKSEIGCYIFVLFCGFAISLATTAAIWWNFFR